MGNAAASAGAAGSPEGLRAGRISGQTKLEYPAASERRDHATFGSGLTRQSDERDSEPDYMLHPTRHGAGGTLLDYSAFLLERRSPFSSWDSSDRVEGASMTSSTQRDVILNQQ